MTQFEKAALLFGKDGALGEADAIFNYLMFISTLKQDYSTNKPADNIAIEHVLERIGDEINHLLGDTLDAVNMAGLKISSDGIEEILDGLRAAVDTGEEVEEPVEDSTDEELSENSTYEIPQNVDMINL